MKASRHAKENDRIAALRSYRILDTPRESDFDDIVQLASTICDAPISVINLIDVDRQWFKAETGLGVKETPLDTSLCAHAILAESFVEIPDTLSDERMRDNPLCSGDPGLRFYAGALLYTPDQLPIGTLCVLDYKPRQLTEPQKHALIVLGRQVMLQLELRKTLSRQELLLREIDHRVKNSISSISAIIRLQRRAATTEQESEFLATLEGRVSRIGLLHEQLYGSGDIADIQMIAYLNRVREMMIDLVPAHVDIIIDCVSVIADSTFASAVGIITTEFILNAAKHAFPDGRAGTIKIELRYGADQGLELICRDNGKGGDDISLGHKGLGLRLIEAAAAQAGGSSEYNIDRNGFSVTVKMRPPELLADE